MRSDAGMLSHEGVRKEKYNPQPDSVAIMFTQGDIVGLVAVYAYVGLVIVLAAKLKIVRSAKMHRKFVHIMVGNIVFIWWVFDSSYVMALLAAAPFIPLLILASPYSPVKKIRDSFIGQTTGESHDLGLVYYAIAWTALAFFLFDERLIASIAIVSMSYGDGMGGLIGKRFGKKKICGPKTLEGTTAVFVATTLATFVVFVFYGWLNAQHLIIVPEFSLAAAGLFSLLIGAFVAVVELLTPGQYDNLVIPFGTAGLLLVAGL